MGILEIVPLDEPDEAAAAAALRSHGARFAFVYGSRAGEDGRPGSDLDIAAWWGAASPAFWAVDLPDGVDLLVLDDAPLELAGRVALHGRLLFDDDPPARVRLAGSDPARLPRRTGPPARTRLGRLSMPMPSGSSAPTA